MGNKIIILPEDVVLTPETKVLYKSDNGKYYLNEKGAREKLATHFKCNCGNGIREKFRIHCDNCEPPKKEYFKEWDLKTPVYCNTRLKTILRKEIHFLMMLYRLMTINTKMEKPISIHIKKIRINGIVSPATSL